LTHQDPLQGLSNAQTDVITKSTVGYSSNQTPGAVSNQSIDLNLVVCNERRYR
jgi:hypothetical protein